MCNLFIHLCLFFFLFDSGQELRTREGKLLKSILSGASVVLGTPVGLSGGGVLRHVDEEHFDVAVVDEAGQALEIACWMALMRAPRYVLDVCFTCMSCVCVLRVCLARVCFACVSHVCLVCVLRVCFASVFCRCVSWSTLCRAALPGMYTNDI